MFRARLLAVTIAALAACDEAAPPGDDDDDAHALLAEVRRDDYAQWTSDAIEGDAPHGAWSVIFLDAITQAALAGAPREAWPDGATIVCEGRAKQDADAELVMIMRKREGTWWWAQYDAEDAPLVFGTATGCVHCHAAGQDFTRAVKLP